MENSAVEMARDVNNVKRKPCLLSEVVNRPPHIWEGEKLM